MMRLALAAAIVLPIGLAACETPQRPSNTMDARMEGQFFYRCANGERVEMRFTPTAGVAVLIRGDSRTELQRMPTASGFVYQSGETQVMGNAHSLEINTPGQPPLQCHMEQ